MNAAVLRLFGLARDPFTMYQAHHTVGIGQPGKLTYPKNGAYIPTKIKSFRSEFDVSGTKVEKYLEKRGLNSNSLNIIFCAWVSVRV